MVWHYVLESISKLLAIFVFSLSHAQPSTNLIGRMEERSLETLNQSDSALELTLRPSLFSDFTGQDKIKERLEIAVQAARQRGDVLDHILLNGPPGLGKTTLAGIIAKSMGPA